MIMRSVTQKFFVVLGLVALCALLWYIGKGHTLVFDTHEVTIDGTAMRSLPAVTLVVDGKKEGTMRPAERMTVAVSGSTHTIEIGDAANPEKRVQQRITLPMFMDVAVISVPAILGNAPQANWVRPLQQ